MPPNYKRKNQANQRLAAVDDPENGMPKLTAKQERFATLLANGVGAREAYRQAYDTSKSNENTIAVQASKLSRDSKIASFVRGFQRLGLQNASISKDSHLAELARGREIAYELGQASAGIQAEHYRGRVAGLYNDKLSLTIGPSDEVLLAQLAATLGADLAASLGEALGVDDKPLETKESSLLALPSPLDD